MLSFWLHKTKPCLLYRGVERYSAIRLTLSTTMTKSPVSMFVGWGSTENYTFNGVLFCFLFLMELCRGCHSCLGEVLFISMQAYFSVYTHNDVMEADVSPRLRQVWPLNFTGRRSKKEMHVEKKGRTQKRWGKWMKRGGILQPQDPGTLLSLRVQNSSV